jgi:NAD(P)H-flavin reductase
MLGGSPAASADAGTAALLDPMASEPWLILRTQVETRDTFTLVLKPPHGAFAFQPGQFNMLYAFGVGEVPISISGDPARTGELTHTIRAVGPVTRTLQKLKRGDMVGVRGPLGTAWPVSLAEGNDVVLIAGGIGLAPLRPALYHVVTHRERYGRVALLLGARSPKDILFEKEVESWRGRFDLDVEVIVDRAAAGWHGLVGVVTALIPRAHYDPENTVAFVVGPEVMMQFAARDLERRGLLPARMWVSMERNMKCGIGLCGHCQLGPKFICKDGPVFRWDRIAPLAGVREL